MVDLVTANEGQAERGTGAPPSGGPSRVLLVIVGAVFDNTSLKIGAGQRTRMFFDAARAVAPTSVVTIGPHPGADNAALFPGAAEYHHIPYHGLTPPTGGRIEQLWYTFAPLLIPGRANRPADMVRRQLGALARNCPNTLVIFRYYKPFCIAGLVSEPDAGLRIAVDIDDRPDQKYKSNFNILVGNFLTRALIGPLLIDRLMRVLRRRLNRADLLWFVTPEDVWADPKGPATAIAPNTAMQPVVDGDIAPPSASQVILFVGAWTHRPNRSGLAWFLKSCWPTLRDRHPDARVRVVGVGGWHALSSLVPDLRGVEIVGYVDDLAEAYSDARLAICPMAEGGGSKIKLIEACAFGRPVVTTRLSARGFGNDLDQLAVVADTRSDFIAGCSRFLSDGVVADAVGARLMQHQKDHFSRAAVTMAISRDMAGLYAATVPHAAGAPLRSRANHHVGRAHLFTPTSS